MLVRKEDKVAYEWEDEIVQIKWDCIEGRLQITLENGDVISATEFCVYPANGDDLEVEEDEYDDV